MKYAQSALLTLLALCACSTQPEATRSAPPPLEVTQRLARGVNLSSWFTDRGQAHLAARYHPVEEDLARIRALGLRHVRVMWDLAWLADENLQLRKEALHQVQADLQRVYRQGLSVVLVMQASNDFRKRLGHDEAALNATAALWRQLAQNLSSATPEQLLFEPLNEPEIADALRVRLIMQRLTEAIRQAAPRHTVVVSGARYADIEDLRALTPLSDRNVIYSFHFYEPKNFTHQGATWGWNLWPLFRDWPYPSSPDAVLPLLSQHPPEAKEHLLYYGDQRWDAAKLDRLIRAAADWGRQHGVTVWCSEFGAYRYGIRPEHRLPWLRDVRGSLERAGLGWSVWDYAGEFGLVSGDAGQRVLDREAVLALALNPS